MADPAQDSSFKPHLPFSPANYPAENFQPSGQSVPATPSLSPAAPVTPPGPMASPAISTPVVPAPPANPSPILPPEPQPVSPKYKEGVNPGPLPAPVAAETPAAPLEPKPEENDQYWENYAREIELEKEIAEMQGVEKVASGEVKLSEEAKAAGAKPTITVETPIAAVVDFKVRGVSLSDDQLATGLVQPPSSSFRWLVEWFICQLLKAHFLIKRVRGHIFREKKG
jgi:hypothetical protein